MQRRQTETKRCQKLKTSFFLFFSFDFCSLLLSFFPSFLFFYFLYFVFCFFTPHQAWSTFFRFIFFFVRSIVVASYTLNSVKFTCWGNFNVQFVFKMLNRCTLTPWMASIQISSLFVRSLCFAVFSSMLSYVGHVSTVQQQIHWAEFKH